MNTKQKGDMGLGSAIAYFTRQNYTVMVPLTDSQDYDLVVDEKDGNLYRVQVKYTNWQPNKTAYQVGFTIKGGTKGGIWKKASEVVFDKIFVLTGDGHTYYIPRSKIEGGCINLRPDGKYKEFLV